MILSFDRFGRGVGVRRAEKDLARIDVGQALLYFRPNFVDQPIADATRSQATMIAWSSDCVPSTDSITNTEAVTGRIDTLRNARVHLARKGHRLVGRDADGGGADVQFGRVKSRSAAKIGPAPKRKAASSDCKSPGGVHGENSFKAGKGSE